MPKQKIKSFVTSFKEFVSKGNIIDMAVGVVIGGSFGKIVTGLVNYIINPFVAIFVKSGSLDSVKTIVTEAVTNEAGEVVTPEVAILWGTWLQTVIDFLITALCIFIVLRIFLKAKDAFNAKKIEEEKAAAEEKKAKEEADKAAAEKAAAELAEKNARLEESILAQEKLLGEIRDALKQK